MRAGVFTFYPFYLSIMYIKETEDNRNLRFVNNPPKKVLRNM